MQYFEAARRFPDVDADHWSLRVGLVLPVRALQAVFGPSEVAYHALPVAAGLLLVAATVVVGSRLHSLVVGLGAAAVVGSSNWFLSYSSALLPDHVAAALVVGALAVLLLGESSSRSRRVVVGAGVLLAWAYLIREFTLLLWPVALLVALGPGPSRAPDTARPWRQTVRWLGLPVVAAMIGETVLNFAVHGDPLARWTVAGSHDEVVRDLGADVTRFDALVLLPDALVSREGTASLLLLLLAAPLTALFAVRRRWTIVAWLAAYWIPLTLAGGVLSPDLRFLRAQLLRYWTPILPAAAIGGLGLVWLLALGGSARLGVPPRAAALVSALAVVVAAGWVVQSSWPAVERADIYEGNGATQLDELRAWLADEGADVGVVWTDSQTARLMPIVARTPTGGRVWDGEVRSFNDPDDPHDFVDPAVFAPGDVVVFYPFGYLGRLDSWSDIPPGIRRLQPGWETVLRRSDDTLLLYEIG